MVPMLYGQGTMMLLLMVVLVLNVSRKPNMGACSFTWPCLRVQETRDIRDLDTSDLALQAKVFKKEGFSRSRLNLADIISFQ